MVARGMVMLALVGPFLDSLCCVPLPLRQWPPYLTYYYMWAVVGGAPGAEQPELVAH